MRWVPVSEQKPPTIEPVIYAKPDSRRGEGHWHVGIAYWTVSETWNPEAESEAYPEGFTHWLALPRAPKQES